MAQTTTAPASEKAALDLALHHINNGAWPDAEAILLPLTAGDTAGPEPLQLLGTMRRAQGRLGEAEALYRRALAHAPDLAHVHHNLGNLLADLGRIDEAVAAYTSALALKPNFAEAHLHLAIALMRKPDPAAAEKCCRMALKLQPNYILAKQVLSDALCAQDKAREAERLLRQTLALGVRDPRQAAALEHNLALALKQQGRFHDALALFDSAQAKAPELDAVEFNRGSTLQQLGLIEQAASAYRRAVAQDESDPEAHAALAVTLAQLGDFAGAAAHAGRALALAPRHPLASIALAIARIENDAIDEADEALEAVLSYLDSADDERVSFALGFAADAFDRRGRADKAFSLQRDSNRRRRSLLAARFEGARVIDDVLRLHAFFEKSAPWQAPATARPCKDAAARHVFLLGFMRSGTTLLETVLVSNPSVTGMDEIEFLTEPARAFLLDDEGLRRLAHLSEHEAEIWRSAYWRAVRDAGIPAAGKVFIDKMPFNSLRLPLIARLFPEAKVLFALRDPRDVVLSCFRRRFSPTPFSYEFLSLEDCARFYAATMSLAERYRATLPLDIRLHRYEDIVADFDGTIRSICEHIGVAWSPSMRDFGGVARAVDRRSASAAQVRRGLYGGAAGQWRRYAKDLEPVLPMLAPWVEKFGYAPD